MNELSRRRRIEQAAINHIRSSIATTPGEWREMEVGLGIEITDLSPSERLVEHSDGLIDHDMDVVEICARAIELADGDPGRAEWAFDIASNDLIRDLHANLDDGNVPENLRRWVFEPTAADLARPASGVDREYLSLAVDAVVALTLLYNMEAWVQSEVRELTLEFTYLSGRAFPLTVLETKESNTFKAIDRLVAHAGVPVEKIHELGVLLQNGEEWLSTHDSYRAGTDWVFRRAFELERR